MASMFEIKHAHSTSGHVSWKESSPSSSAAPISATYASELNESSELLALDAGRQPCVRAYEYDATLRYLKLRLR